MPIYEYVCSDCGHQFEALVRGDKKPSCPSCGRRKLAKQLSVPAAHTAGSEPVCPAREVGACQASSCSSGRCSFGGLS
jgi:putative FmdB family regulatory protein